MGWDPVEGSVLSRPLKGGNTAFKGDFVSRGKLLYLWQPGSEQVEVLKEDLENIESLPLPGLRDVPDSLKLAVSRRGPALYLH